MKKLLTLLLVLVVVVSATAFNAFAATATETVSANTDSKTISVDTELTVNSGVTITTLTVNEGVTVTIKGDGSIGAFDGKGTVILGNTAKETVTVNGTSCEVIFSTLNLAGDTLKLGTAGVNLIMDGIETNGASMSYTSVFKGNADIKALVKNYGVAMYLDSEDNLFKPNSFTTNAGSAWDTNSYFTDNGVALKGIMKTGNVSSMNKANASRQVHNVPYVELTSGLRIVAADDSRSFKNMVEKLTKKENPGSDIWDGLNDTQKTNFFNMYETFEKAMSSWDFGRLDPLFKEAAGETYYIYDAFDALKMSTVTGADIQLMKYVNLGGATIDGLSNFTGSFDGNGHTIQNFTLNGTGLVDQVATGESITELYLGDVTMVVPSDSEAQSVGLIAGTNYGTITGVAAKGTIKDTRENVAMGALVGNNQGTLSAYPIWNDETVVSTLKTDGSGIGDKNTTYTVDNLVASVGLYNDADGVTKGLVGTGNAVTNATDDTKPVYWRDRSNSTDREVAALRSKREIVVNDVFEQGTIKWTVPSKMAYYNNQSTQPSFNKGDREWVQTGTWPWQGSWVGTYHIHNQQFNPGTVYHGIPYTHIASSLEQAKFYMTKGANDVYTFKSEIASLVGGSDNKAGNATWSGGGLGWARYLGSDCSAALALAWHKVSPIRDLNRTESNKGVSPYYTTNIVPSEFNQWNYGIVKVGDYTVNDAALAATYELTGTDFTTSDKKQTKTDYGIKSDMIIMDIIDNQEGGIQTVYEAYADSQMGDILSAAGKASHTRLIALDPIVIRNGAGDIDPAKSYFVTHEQGDGLYERADTLSSWRINYKYTFEQLAYQNIDGLTGSTGYYLPITMNAFHDASMKLTGGITLSGGRAIGDTNDPSYVVINSTFRIQNATMTITDAPNGNILYQKTAYQGTSVSQDRRRAVPGNVPMYMSEFFGDYGANLTEGQTYYLTIGGTGFNTTTPNNVYTNHAFVYTPAS